MPSKAIHDIESFLGITQLNQGIKGFSEWGTQTRRQREMDFAHLTFGALELGANAFGVEDVVKGGLAIAGRSVERSSLLKGVADTIAKHVLDSDDKFLQSKSLTEAFFRTGTSKSSKADDTFEDVFSRRSDAPPRVPTSLMETDRSHVANYLLTGRIPANAPSNFGDLVTSHVRREMYSLFRSPRMPDMRPVLRSSVFDAISRNLSRTVTRVFSDTASDLLKLLRVQNRPLRPTATRLLEDTVRTRTRDPLITDYISDDFFASDNHDRFLETNLHGREDDDRYLFFKIPYPKEPEEDVPISTSRLARAGGVETGDAAEDLQQGIVKTRMDLYLQNRF